MAKRHGWGGKGEGEEIEDEEGDPRVSLVLCNAPIVLEERGKEILKCVSSSLSINDTVFQGNPV